MLINRRNLNRINAKSILLTYFERIKRKPNISPSLNGLSDVFSKKYRRHCFNEARRAFFLFLSKRKVERFLKCKPSRDRGKYLKKVRRLGIILIVMYIFFDKTHKCPKNLGKFLTELGRYNDRYWIDNSNGSGVHLSIAKLNFREMTLNPASNKDVKKYASRRLSRIRKSLERTKFLAQEFHVLRKNVRSFASLLQVAAAENHRGSLHWLFVSLLNLSSELGDKHDKLVVCDLQGKAEYHLSTVTIGKTFFRRFKRIDPFIKKVLGLH